MLAQFGDKVVRRATLNDLESMNILLMPVIVDYNESESMQEMHKRTLLKMLKYHIEHKETLVIENATGAVACYAGGPNFITYIISNAKDPEVLGILMYFVLCALHNRYADSIFQTELNEQKRVFQNMSLIEFKGNIGTISVESKNKVEKLFNKIKDYYGETS
jgi:hypothetical protein